MRDTSERDSVHYELVVTPDEARSGAARLLTRNNRRLEVRIPPGVSTGSVVKLTNALLTTDGRPGDILIDVKVVAEEPRYEAPPSVVDITDGTFESEVLRSPLPVVVDFWAPWCGPCRMMAPVMEQAAAQYHGQFKFCKINVDENPASASQFQAMSIPMLLAFRNGQVVARNVGAISAGRLRSWLNQF